MKIIHCISIAFIFLTSLSAQATLITNGSFEQTNFADDQLSIGEIFSTELSAFERKKRGWDVFEALPGWRTTAGNGIELQKGVVTNSQHGSHHIELDSHQRGGSNSMMTQTIDSLIIGNEYLLEFFYKARTNNKNDNGINVYWYDTPTAFDASMEAMYIADATRRETPNWQKQSVVFTATASSMELSFASVGKQNTLGGLVDNVSLNQITQVPEPSILVLLMLSLGLLVSRRKS
ncbi:DUF642 domain-containing protein [Thalassotalea sp. M1531]|uniref:DUF642 domain-containing protein n=1 Tax=Thalassotalea algicola TaxID=2716224 RepID=A0A7Y0Q4H0_9GAMM|nr:DUF642 domain-containing protein [Thalassotalea algicola]NMP29944.1 DUF642 domain-containing protein [Thalassotalea algicola]